MYASMLTCYSLLRDSLEERLKCLLFGSSAVLSRGKDARNVFCFVLKEHLRFKVALMDEYLRESLGLGF